MIALNPRANAELLDWLASLDDDELTAALARRRDLGIPPDTSLNDDVIEAEAEDAYTRSTPSTLFGYTDQIVVNPNYQVARLSRPMSWLVICLAILLAVVLISGIVLIAIFVITGSEPLTTQSSEIRARS